MTNEVQKWCHLCRVCGGKYPKHWASEWAPIHSACSSVLAERNELLSEVESRHFADRIFSAIAELEAGNQEGGCLNFSMEELILLLNTLKNLEKRPSI